QPAYLTGELAGGDRDLVPCITLSRVIHVLARRHVEPGVRLAVDEDHVLPYRGTEHHRSSVEEIGVHVGDLVDVPREELEGLRKHALRRQGRRVLDLLVARVAAGDAVAVRAERGRREGDALEDAGLGGGVVEPPVARELPTVQGVGAGEVDYRSDLDADLPGHAPDRRRDDGLTRT